MKRIYFLLLLLITTSLSAQRSGFVKLEQLKFAEAEEIFNFTLQEKKNNVAAYHGLSMLFSRKDFDKFSMAKAFAYSDSALIFFPQFSANDKKEYQPIFTEESLKLNFQTLEKNLFSEAKEKDEAAIREYLSTYPKSTFAEETKKIIELYEELKRIENKNLLDVYNEFIEKHPNFAGKKFAVEKRNAKAFIEAKKQNTSEAFSVFIEKYPNAKEIEYAYNERIKCDSIEIIVASFRGNEKRNYYGENAPSNLNLIWKINLGSGQSKVKENPKVWQGAGWTGQPLLVNEKGKFYILQGAFDYNLRKIDAQTGEIIWKYKFDDILKGTGTLFVNKTAKNLDERYIIMQGSRYGQNLDLETAKVVPSFRAISYISGKELWRMNSQKTMSYSRDVDGSALVLNDTAFIGLENGLFTVFDPNPANCKDTLGIFQPLIYSQTWLYRKRDYVENSSNLVTESSPVLLKNRIYLTSGSGHVYGYNLKTKELDWDYYIGADLDGSAVVSHDQKLYITLEKEFIKGQGGVLKINPEKEIKSCEEWFFPTENRIFGEWQGGIIGTVATNEATNKNQKYPQMVAFIGIDGWLYVINSTELQKDKLVDSPNLDKKLPTPKLIFKYKVNASISSPIFAENKLIVPSSTGIYLFEFDEKLNFKLKASKIGSNFEASPIVWNGKIYIASRDGYLYCFGN